MTTGIIIFGSGKTMLGRAIERFGDRVLEGGDMFESHRKFIDNVSRYDTDGSPNLSEQMRWAESMNCRVLRLSGEMSVERNSEGLWEHILKRSD